jgi:hypothetical protein
MTDEQRLTPQTYVLVTLQTLWDELPRVVVGALGFSLLAAPAFVLAVLGLWLPAWMAGLLLGIPGWTALMGWEAKLLEGRVPAWQSLWLGWVQNWTASVRLGVLAIFPLALVWLWGEQLPPAGSGWRMIYGGAALYAVLWLAMAVLYILPGLAIYGWRPYTALRNGWLLAARFPLHTVGLMALGVLGYFAVAYLSGGFLFILPAVLGLFVANNLRLVVGLSR